MLRIFFAFVKKETYHILRDTRTLVILFGMPIALVLIFGYTVTNEFRDASITIIDQSKDELSQDFIEHMTASEHFQLVKFIDNVNLLEQEFKKGTVKMGLVIPPSFESDFFQKQKVTVQIITDASEPNYATTLTNYATRMIFAFQNKYSKSNTLPYQIDTEIRMMYNPRLVGAYNFIPGVAALILMLISAMMTSLTIAKEKEMGTMDLLLVSPLPPMLIIVGKVTPYVLLSFIDALIVFAMGYYVFEVPIRGSLALLLVLSLLFLMVALALGVLISTKSKTQQSAMMSSLFSLLLPTMLLSGFMFPIASMPPLLQYISKIVPATYFLQIEQGIMLKGTGLKELAHPVMVLSVMMVTLFLAAWKSFKVIYK